MALILAVEDNLVKGAAGQAIQNMNLMFGLPEATGLTALPVLPVGERRVPMPAWWRRLRRHFGISAPRMAVRTHLSWPWRAVVVAALVAVIGGMWWWGFDFGQILGGLNRREIEEKIVSLEAEAARLRAETARAAAKSAQPRKRARDARGRAVDAVEAGRRPAERELPAQGRARVPAEAGRRLEPAGRAVDPAPRGRAPARRRVPLQPCWWCAAATRRRSSRASSACRSRSRRPRPTAAAGRRCCRCPTTSPSVAAPLKLNFKYYQRVEGTLPGFAGSRVAVVDRARLRGRPRQSARHPELEFSLRRRHVGTQEALAAEADRQPDRRRHRGPR